MQSPFLSRDCTFGKKKILVDFFFYWSVLKGPLLNFRKRILRSGETIYFSVQGAPSRIAEV